MISGMMKAAAPMTGGMIMEPVEPMASMAPATSGRYPAFFMRGIVKTPTAATLATWLPVIMPKRQLPNIAAFAGPPRYFPNKAIPESIKSGPAPDTCRNAPKIMNMTITVAETPRAGPRMPSVVRNMKVTTRSKVKPEWAR